MAAGFSEGGFSGRSSSDGWELGGSFGAGGEKNPDPKRKKDKKPSKKSGDAPTSRSQTAPAETETGGAGTQRRERQKDRVVALGDWLVSHDTEKKPDWLSKKSKEKTEDTKPEPKPEDFTERSSQAGERTAERPEPEASADSEDRARRPEVGNERQEDERDSSSEERGYDEDDWPAQGFVLPLDAVSGGESIDFVLSLHDAEPPRPETEKDSGKKVEEPEETPELVSAADGSQEQVISRGEGVDNLPEGVIRPVVNGPEAGQFEESLRQHYAREYEALIASATPSSETGSPNPVASPESLVPVGNAEPGADSPDAEPAAPVEELADDISVLPIATEHSANLGVEGWSPAAAYRRYNERDVAARHGEELVTKRELDDAVYSAAKTNLGRGLATGLFVGGMYEHIKHKRREKKQTKKLMQQHDKDVRQIREDHHFYYDEQTEQQAETQRQLEAAQQQSALAERQLREQEFAQRQTNERLVALQETTKRQQTEAAKAHEVPALKGRAPEEVDQRLEIPQEHVLQTSAWHSIEIDKRTGRPVENPTFMYGHEYYRERAHEAGPVSRRNAAAGEVALVAAARGTATGNGGGAGTQGSGTSGPVDIPSATMQGPPAAKQRAKNAVSGLRGQLAASSTGPLWPYLVALVVILFCLVALLH